LNRGSGVTDTIVDSAGGEESDAGDGCGITFEESDDEGNAEEAQKSTPIGGYEGATIAKKSRRRPAKEQKSALTRALEGIPRAMQNNVIFRVAKRLGRALDIAPRSVAGQRARGFGLSGVCDLGSNHGSDINHPASLANMGSKAFSFCRRFLTDETADFVAEIRKLDPAFSLSHFIQHEAEDKILRVLEAYFSNRQIDFALLEREVTPRALANLLTTLRTRLESEYNVMFVPYYVRSPTVAHADAERREISLVYIVSAIYFLYDDAGDTIIGSEWGRDFQVEAKMVWRGTGMAGWVIDDLNLSILNPRIRPSFV